MLVFLGCRRQRWASQLIFVSYLFLFACRRQQRAKIPTHVIFGYFSLVAKDDEDKPLGLSSYLCVFFLSCKWWWWARILTHHHPLLFFFRCKRQQQASQLLVVFYIFFLQLYDDEPLDSLLSLGFLLQLPTMMTS